ncbi:hypothetical protein [Streptomyces sp. NPDC056883]|uniref:hypothetical protein n=1 Tax=Streptomyces sp. NPDC056883 TaxID=3345959 RepID=UPI00369E3B80
MLSGHITVRWALIPAGVDPGTSPVVAVEGALAWAAGLAMYLAPGRIRHLLGMAR